MTKFESRHPLPTAGSEICLACTQEASPAKALRRAGALAKAGVWDYFIGI
jgi:hypothetical protein